MKNAIKWFGIIVMVAVIGFSMAACDNDPAPAPVVPVIPGGSSNPDEIGETIRLSNVSVEVPKGAPATLDFGYVSCVSLFPDDTGIISMSIQPLADILTGTPKAQITGNRLTLELDAPEGELLAARAYQGVTLEPGDAKVTPLFFSFSDTLEIKDGYFQLMMGATLLYADTDVKINGTYLYVEGSGSTLKMTYNNVTLKKGWNYLSPNTTRIEGKEYIAETKYTASQTRPAGAKWVVMEMPSLPLP